MDNFQNKSGVAKAGRVTEERDVVTSPALSKWAVQGKLFHAGFGMEDADGEENASGAAFDDTKATFALQSPNSSSLLVIPTLFRLMFSDDGGGYSQFQICMTLPADECATTLALSGGTDMTFRQPVYAKNPALAAPQSTAQYGDTITVSAMTNADYVSVYYGWIVNAALTTGLPTGGRPSVVEVDLLKHCPYILSSGAAMLIYFITGTSDAIASAYLKWAEVTEDDLV